MKKHNFLQIGAAAFATLLFAACGESAFTNGKASSSGTVVRKCESQEAAHVAKVLADYEKNKTQEIDVLTFLQQQHQWDSTIRARLKGCGKTSYALSKDMLWFYPAKNPTGVLLISPGFMLLPKTGMKDFIDNALDNNLSVLLLQPSGQKEHNKNADDMNANTWKKEEKAAMCLLSKLREHNKYANALMIAHSMSALLAELAFEDEYLHQWAEGNLRLVNVTPAYSLSIEQFAPQLVNDPQKALSTLKLAESAIGSLGKLFAGNNAVHDKVPDKGILAVLSLQKETRTRLQSKPKARVSILNIVHKDDIAVDPNNLFQEKGLRYSVSTSGSHGPNVDDWDIIHNFLVNKKVPQGATDNASHRYPDPLQKSGLGNIIKSGGSGGLGGLLSKFL